MREWTALKRLQPAALLFLFLAASLSFAASQARQEKWATPVRSGGLTNFFQIDARVYRSAQPDAKGFKELQGRGIRNVLSFRDHHADTNAARGTNVKLFRIQMEAGDIKTPQVVEALRIIKSADGPILIHCWHGADRTGLISAMYRIVFQNWSREDAIDELMNGGYGYHPIYKNIPEYIRQVDIEAVKRQVMAK
jgi:protein tyrosine/serine phosphatase